MRVIDLANIINAKSVALEVTYPDGSVSSVLYQVFSPRDFIVNESAMATVTAIEPVTEKAILVKASF